jgi:hypothetical protein
MDAATLARLPGIDRWEGGPFGAHSPNSLIVPMPYHINRAHWWIYNFLSEGSRSELKRMVWKRAGLGLGVVWVWLFVK